MRDSDSHSVVYFFIALCRAYCLYFKGVPKGTTTNQYTEADRYTVYGLYLP